MMQRQVATSRIWIVARVRARSERGAHLCNQPAQLCPTYMLVDGVVQPPVLRGKRLLAGRWAHALQLLLGCLGTLPRGPGWWQWGEIGLCQLLKGNWSSFRGHRLKHLHQGYAQRARPWQLT